MSDIFRAIVSQAVVDLQSYQKRHPMSEPVVWAIPTLGNEPGSVIVTGPNGRPDDRFYNRPPGYMPRVIRPRDNNASTLNSWGWVPFSAQFGVLYQALYREPILPPVTSTVCGRVA